MTFSLLLEANLPLEAFNELASIVEKYGNGENIYSFSAQFLGASLT